MKKILILLFLINLNSLAQTKNLKSIVANYPKFDNIENLVYRINSDFNSDYHKIKAAYFWLALNIRYYIETTNFIMPNKTFVYFNEADLKRQKKKYHQEIVKETFKTKTSICQGYAYSFQEICNLLNIKNETIKGYVKDSPNKIGVVPKFKNHIWNAVKIKNRWVLLDITYGSNSIYKNGRWKQEVDLFYFDIKKEKIKQTHYPEKEKWRKFLNQEPLKNFSISPILYKEFSSSNVEIISPKNGEIKISKQLKNIVLKFKHLNKVKVLYSYGNDKFSKHPKVQKYNDITVISLKKPSKDNTLNIYFNNKLALQFKVKFE